YSLLLVRTEIAQLAARMNTQSQLFRDPADNLNGATDAPRVVLGKTDGDVVGVARVNAFPSLHLVGDSGVKAKEREVGQTRTGGSALRQAVLVSAETHQQCRRLGVPADAAEICVHTGGLDGGKEIHDIHLDQHPLPHMWRRVVHNRLAPLKPGGGGMDSQPGQKSAQDTSLQFLQVRFGNEQSPCPASLFGNMTLAVVRFEIHDLFKRHGQNPSQVVKAAPATELGTKPLQGPAVSCMQIPAIHSRRTRDETARRDDAGHNKRPDESGFHERIPGGGKVPGAAKCHAWPALLRWAHKRVCASHRPSSLGSANATRLTKHQPSLIEELHQGKGILWRWAGRVQGSGKGLLQRVAAQVTSATPPSPC